MARSRHRAAHLKRPGYAIDTTIDPRDLAPTLAHKARRVFMGGQINGTPARRSGAGTLPAQCAAMACGVAQGTPQLASR